MVWLNRVNTIRLIEASLYDNCLDDYHDNHYQGEGKADSQGHVVQRPGRIALPLRGDLVAGHVGITGLKDGEGVRLDYPKK